MKEVILVKNGEIALKGQNRSSFEDMLVKNMRRRLRFMGDFTFTKAQSTIIIEPPQGAELDLVEQIVSRVFGIAAFSRAASLQKDMDVILEQAPQYLEEQLLQAKTFKVEAKRSDKAFAYQSPQISAMLGERLLDKFPHLTVDVHNPDVTVRVEIRDREAFVHGTQLRGAGGLPTGSAGRAALLISGGIDSPVAGYMMAKRGLELFCIHFASPPYTSDRAHEKVKSLLAQLARYSGRINLCTVGFTQIQESIRDLCPDDYFTLIMRCFMMRISSILAARNDCAALITGESLGQVASQTLPAIACTDSQADIPVFRPLIGMDKEEIITISRKIETFDISVLPYEDCCTVFTPRHPRTRPRIEDVLKAQSALDVQVLINAALENVAYTEIDAAHI